MPRYSQEIHEGQYPEYDNGGEAWCSPTSSQMIIEYWGGKPTAEDLAWVDPSYADPQVCHAARFTYDYQYAGCGNWPFNAAYAATYKDLQGVVTRLGSLTDLETLIAAGIPAITSQSFLKEELTGAGYGTAGHLMTVIGFTADGDVIANDPASPEQRRGAARLQAARVGEHLAPDQAVQRLRQGRLRHRRRLLPVLPGPPDRAPAQGAGGGGRALSGHGCCGARRGGRSRVTKLSAAKAAIRWQGGQTGGGSPLPYATSARCHDRDTQPPPPAPVPAGPRTTARRSSSTSWAGLSSW